MTMIVNTGAYIGTQRLNEKGVERPLFSPDLSPIEHIWDEMDKRMKQSLLHV